MGIRVQRISLERIHSVITRVINCWKRNWKIFEIGISTKILILKKIRRIRKFDSTYQLVPPDIRPFYAFYRIKSIPIFSISSSLKRFLLNPIGIVLLSDETSKLRWKKMGSKKNRKYSGITRVQMPISFRLWLAGMKKVWRRTIWRIERFNLIDVTSK